MRKVIEDVILEMGKKLEKALNNKKQGDLEGYWCFKWKESRSLEENLYAFYDLLKMYEGFCEQWEEQQKGHICIVGRVRDRYVMPKIKELVKDIKKRNKNVL